MNTNDQTFPLEFILFVARILEQLRNRVEPYIFNETISVMLGEREEFLSVKFIVTMYADDEKTHGVCLEILFETGLYMAENYKMTVFGEIPTPAAIDKTMKLMYCLNSEATAILNPVSR